MPMSNKFIYKRLFLFAHNMAFYSSGSKKLPNFVTQEEFERIFSEVIRLEKKTSALKRKRLRQYRIAMLLGFEAGMRISEIVGWKVIPKLKKENISDVSIRILGKGGKERIVPRPRRLSDKAVEMLPLAVSRRALQAFVEKLGKDILKRHIGFHCVDTDTEVLTDGGWKKYNEIKKGENIFTYNLEKDEIEIFRTREIFSKPYSGEMYHIKNKYIDSLVTPDHKIIAKYSTLRQIKKKRKDIWNSTKWKLIPLNEILSHKSLRQIKYKLSALKSDWNNGLMIGKTKAGILGWILSDGCISKGEITIHQSISANPDKCKIISELLANSNIPYSIKLQKEMINDFSKNKYQMIIFRILKGGDHSNNPKKMGKNHNWIYKFINKDRTPNLSTILKLNKEELEMIYKNMMLGDGTILIKNSREYCGQDKKRIDLIRILACLLNKRTVILELILQNKILAIFITI